MRIRLPDLLRNPRGRRPSDVNDARDVTDALQSVSDEQPERVAPTFDENLENLCVHEASKLLIEREDRLFGANETDAFIRHQEDVDQLDADYRKLKELVLEILEKNMFVRQGATSSLLSSAVKTIYQEEEQYNMWNRENRTPPSWRQSGWKESHDMLIRDLVKERFETPPTPPPDTKESLQREVNHMGKQLKEDLLWVVEELKVCYPEKTDICNFYARMYHQVFSNRLRKVSEIILVDKDVSFLLRWVNEFYPEILQKPELAAEIDAEALGKLLSQKELNPLEEQYLSKQQSELTTYISRVLEEAEQRWNNAEEPPREDGCYVSPVAYDIIQVINGMVTSSQVVVGDLQKAQSITCKLSSLMERFKNFQNSIIKKNKANSTAYIKANLGCIEQFRDVLDKKVHLFTEDERKKCLCIVAEMKQSAHTNLLSSIHESLKAQYRKLGTSDWLNKSVFENLMENIETKIQDLQGLTASCQQELIGQFHQEVAVKYVKRLLKGHVKLKDQGQQEQAYTVVKQNAETLHNVFSRMGSRDEWLKDVLTEIAEVLRLQDLQAIQVQVASLGSSFPDISEKHVSALLKLKTNVSKADRKVVKETLSDILKEPSAANAPRFFSNIQVK